MNVFFAIPAFVASPAMAFFSELNHLPAMSIKTHIEDMRESLKISRHVVPGPCNDWTEECTTGRRAEQYQVATGDGDQDMYIGLLL